MMKDGKRILMYDGTLLANAYSSKNSDRTGVFVVAQNIFLQLLKHADFSVVVCSAEPVKHIVRRAVIEYGLQNVPVVSDEDAGAYAPDIFFSPYFPIPAFAANNPGIAKYTMLHDVTPLVLPEEEAQNQAGFDRLVRGLNRNDCYFANSQHTRRDFLRYFPVLDPAKMWVTYLAAADHFYPCKDTAAIRRVKDRYGIPADKPYVFSLCTLQPRKNLVHAVKCFAEFVRRNEIDDLYFVLGGGHWEAFIALLDQEVDSLGEVRQRIIKTGYVSDADLAPLYSGAMFTVYVSLYEGFGLPVLEAMQCGCPVITSTVSSMPEVIGDAGIMVEPQDPVALEKAYERYYFDAAFRDQCRESGLARASLFSWETCVNQIVDKIEASWQGVIVKPRAGKTGAREWARQERKRALFGKVRTEEKTALRLFGLPFVEKRRAPDVTRYHVLGLPIFKRCHAGYEEKTYLLGVPIRTRPNYSFIDSQIDLYTGSLADAIARRGKCSYEAADLVSFYTLLEKIQRDSAALRKELVEVDGMIAAATIREGDGNT